MTESTDFSRLLGSTLGTFTSKAEGAERILRSDAAAFRVIQEKRGAMGIVYICDPLTRDGSEIDEDSRNGRRARLALKTLPDAVFFDQRIQQAFRSTGFLWTRLRGVPFVVPAFDQVLVDGKPHIVMMAVPPDKAGRVSLADHIQNAPGGLPPDQCLSMALCLAFGMCQATTHEAGLVHGDIKPSNILMLADYAMISDFGIAPAADAAGIPGVWGAEAYMAPECWSDPETGRAAFSTASDLYAFGCTLLHALTGSAPFAGNRETLREAHRSGAPAENLPIDAPVLALRLEALARHCIQIDPAARPASFAAVRESLIEIARQEAPACLQKVQHFAENAMVQSKMSSSVGDQLSAMLARGDRDGARRLLDKIPEDALSGADLISAGSAASLAGDDIRALTFFDRFEAACTGAAQDDIALCANEKGLSLARLERYGEAIETYTDGLTFASGRRRAALISNRAMSHLKMGDTGSAGHALDQLLHEHPDLAEIWGQLALVRVEEGHAAAAEEAIQRAVSLEPRNGQFRAILGGIQMDLRRDVSSAKASLDLAYELGGADLDWARRMIICCILTGETGNATAILQSATQNLSKSQADALTREIAASARSFLPDAVSGTVTDAAAMPDTSPETEEAKQETHPTAPIATVQSTKLADATDDTALTDQPAILDKPAAASDTPATTPTSAEQPSRAVRLEAEEAREAKSMPTTISAETVPVLSANEDTLRDMALEDLHKDFDTTPTDSGTARQLIEALLESDAVDEARTICARLCRMLDEPENDPDALVAGAQIAHAAGNLDDAEIMLEKAQKLAPRDQLARRIRLEVLEALGDDEKYRSVHAELMAHSVH